MGSANDVTDDTLRALSTLRVEGETFLSVYLDLDPTEFATGGARASQVDSLLDRTSREIEGARRPHAELQALRAGLQRLGGLIARLPALAQGAHGLALFVCEPLRIERALRLPHPVVDAAIVSDAPFIAPLAEQGAPGRVCVALVDERFARLLRGSGERLREVVSFGDDVHGRHDQGGWSQARYQRAIFESVEAHLRHVAKVLADLLRISPYDRLLIACAQPLWSRICDRLHPDVRALARDERLALDVGDATVADVEQAAAPVLAAEQRAHEDSVLARLRERHGREEDPRAATGLGEVLQALTQRRVEALLYEAGLAAPGVLCPRCGWMDGDGADRCPVDGAPLQRRENIVEEALQSALRQSAEVLPLRERPDLGPLGRIAATLRF